MTDEIIKAEITLSEAEIAKLRSKAAGEIACEQRDRLKAAMYEDFLQEERAKFEPQEEIVRFIVVPPDAHVNAEPDVHVLRIPTVNIVDPLTMTSGVRVNNKIFRSGNMEPYEVKRSLFAMVAHSAQCAMRIESAVGNPNRDYNVMRTVDLRKPVVNTISSIVGV
jgi:hypothetical protein